MDAFFVSCELLRRPDLRGKPVVVGPSGDRGVVAAASYEARRYGVHSAMPISTARRRCRDLITLRGDRDLYRRGSRAVMEVLEEFSDVVEVVGLDEAFVDLTGSPAPKARARQIKLRIRERTRLTCSVGIGPNRIIAKIASDLQKPDGICVLPRERFLEVIGDRPARIIPGVGPKTEQRLGAAGIETVRQLAEAAPAELESRLGPSHGSGLRRRAQGYGSTVLAIERERKSESRERTFSVDETDEDVMSEEIERMANAVASHLAEQGIEGRTVTLKIRLTPFRTFTRSRSLDAHTNDPELVARTAVAIFSDFERDAPVRLLGVGVSNLLHPAGATGGARQETDPSPTDLPPEEGPDGELRLPLD